ncbi:hypothetical protein A5695_22055 [Mycobacterium sp. E1747]|nr:hypothetical protein A5695_22055 [Mycobacterium sp. E1747]
MNRRMLTDAEVAWHLADAARPCLNRPQRQMIYIELGAGDELRAIERILRTVVDRGFELPPGAIKMVRSWTERYRGSAFEPMFDHLLGGLAPRNDYSGTENVDGPIGEVYRLNLRPRSYANLQYGRAAHSA